jgi:tetratricopeptide (TPR) repeat protein
VICATLRNLRARMLLHAGRAADAENLLREAIPVHEQAGNQPRLAQALLIQAESLLLEGDAASARRAALLAERVLKIHDASGHPPGISSARHVLGRALHVAGDAASARRCYERAADVASPVLHAEALASLGHLLLETGESDAARRIACACVTAAAEHDLATVRWCATLLAVAVLRDEQPVACAGWLRALVASDALDVVSRRRADALAAGLPSGATGAATLDAAAMLAAMRTALEAARAD